MSRTSLSIERARIEGYGLTTAKILYGFPDAPDILQEIILSKYDTAPDYPEWRRYFKWWRENIEGPLHSVRLFHSRLLTLHEVRFVSNQLNLN